MNGRPHYHALLFSDSVEFIPFDYRLNRNLWSSDVVERKWQGRGFCPVGRVEWDSIGYVARYCMKKRHGAAASFYDDGKVREFSTQSRRPAIGRRYFEKYWQEMYPLDQVLVNGKLRKPPPRYDKWLEEADFELWERVKAKREEEQRPDTTPEELANIELHMESARRRWVSARKTL